MSDLRTQLRDTQEEARYEAEITTNLNLQLRHSLDQNVTLRERNSLLSKEIERLAEHYVLDKALVGKLTAHLTECLEAEKDWDRRWNEQYRTIEENADEIERLEQEVKDEIERRVATREDVLRARAIMQAALNTAVDYYPEGVEQWMQNWISESNRVDDDSDDDA